MTFDTLSIKLKESLLILVSFISCAFTVVNKKRPNSDVMYFINEFFMAYFNFGSFCVLSFKKPNACFTAKSELAT